MDNTFLRRPFQTYIETGISAGWSWPHVLPATAQAYLETGIDVDLVYNSTANTVNRLVEIGGETPQTSVGRDLQRDEIVRQAKIGATPFAQRQEDEWLTLQ